MTAQGAEKHRGTRPPRRWTEGAVIETEGLAVIAAAVEGPLFADRGLGVVIIDEQRQRREPLQKLLEVSIADTYTPWEWQDYVPYDQERTR